MSETSFTTRRWMTPPPIYESRRSARDGTTLKPYLTLPYLLSLTWLAYPILSLLFIAFRLQISSASAQDAVANAKDNLLTSCKAAEQAATAAASLPRYMAASSNKQIADAVNDTMNAARAALVLSLTILEAILNFLIDIYRSTFFCFLELVVQGGLSVLIAAVQEISTFITNTLSGIRTSIQNDVATANSAIASAIGAINKVNPFGNISVPQFSIPSLDALQNVTIPTDFEDALVKLNSSLPSVSQVKSAIEDVVDTPFEDLKADINSTFIGLNFDASVLPVPDQQSLTFCDQMDTSFVDDLGRDLLKAAQIGTIIIIILALLLLGAHCALEWYKWRCLQNHLEYTRQAWVTDPTMQNAVPASEIPSMTMTNHNLLMLSASSQHPLITKIANKLSALLKLSPSKHINLQWFFHYIFHPPALACFLIGFFGLLSVELQLLAIRPLEARYSQQVSASVDDFSKTIATSINASMFNQSSTYADEINGRIDTIQSSINDGLFGWVNGTTTTLNDTLNTFYSDVQNAVSFVFNGTVLETPMQDFVFCIIGTKVEALENVLTFLHDNLLVNIPRVNESVLVLSQADVNEATTPIAQAAVGGGTNDSQGLVGKLIATYVNSLKQERLMFGVFVALWCLVVVIALCIVWWHSYGRRLMNFRERRKWRNEQRANLSDVVVPYKSEPEPAPLDIKNEKDFQEPQSLAPDAYPEEGGFNNVSLRTPVGRTFPGSEETSQHPPFERSWDSFLDSSAGEKGPASTQGVAKRSKRTPRKLMAVGRKAIGNERIISDEERMRMRAAELEDEVDDAIEAGWMKRLTSAFRKKERDETVDFEKTVGSNFSDASASDSPTRSKPKLTITTNSVDFSRMARDQLPTASGDAPVRSPAPIPENVPGSAWSISPGPSQSVPWFANPLSASSKKPKQPRPKQRRNVSVPLSVNSVYGASTYQTQDLNLPTTPVTAAQTPYSATTPVGVPSYYQSNLPQAFGRDSLLPESIIVPRRDHRRSSSVPLPMLNSVSPAKLATIHEPAISQTPGRHLSQSADPFRTPFDDDASVPPMPDRNKVTNPFSP